MRPVSLLVPFGMLLGCSSSSPSSPATVAAEDSGATVTEIGPKCPPRTGNYTFTSARVSGDCGDGFAATAFSVTDSDQLFSIPFVAAEEGGPGATVDVSDLWPDCKGNVTVSRDNCEVTYSVTCKQSSGDSLQKVGSITWTADGASASNPETFKGFDVNGKLLCEGTYTGSATK